MTLAPTKDASLPIAFAGLGVGYYLFTLAKKPSRFVDHMTLADLRASEEWERHARDAKFAAIAGLAAGGLLWWMRA